MVKAVLCQECVHLQPAVGGGIVIRQIRVRLRKRRLRFDLQQIRRNMRNRQGNSCPEIRGKHFRRLHRQSEHQVNGKIPETRIRCTQNRIACLLRRMFSAECRQHIRLKRLHTQR